MASAISQLVSLTSCGTLVIHCSACCNTVTFAQDEKADVILKYMADEARNLKQYGELPENIRVNDADVFEEYEGENDDDIIEFNDVDDI